VGSLGSALADPANLADRNPELQTAVLGPANLRPATGEPCDANPVKPEPTDPTH
jgi:hypothetical protein